MYKDQNIDILSKKYAYYMAGMVGGRFDWLGKDIVTCHKDFNMNRLAKRKCPITSDHFQKMIKIFEEVVNGKSEIADAAKAQFISFLHLFEERVCSDKND
jgi:hypothetical protein